MARVVFTATADADLACVITDLAAKAGIATAERYAGRFDALFSRLAEFPGSGAPRPALGTVTRIGVVSPYVIIYDHMGDEVIVLRILHGRRDITGKLLRS